MKVVVVDNGGQWTHREYRVLRDLGADASIIPNTTPLDQIGAEGIVLSGGALSMEGKHLALGEEGTYLDRATVPILAICVGHQFMAVHFGGEVHRALAPEFGRVVLDVDDGAPTLMEGLPAKFNVWASHNDEVVRVPPVFNVLAHSPSCKVQMMAHRTRPLYGIQFHPEVEHTEHGERIFQNFLSLCHR